MPYIVNESTASSFTKARQSVFIKEDNQFVVQSIIERDNSCAESLESIMNTLDELAEKGFVISLSACLWGPNGLASREATGEHCRYYSPESKF